MSEPADAPGPADATDAPAAEAPPEPLAAVLPASLRVEGDMPVLFWLTHAYPRRINPAWAVSELHHSDGFYTKGPQKPISGCFPGRG